MSSKRIYHPVGHYLLHRALFECFHGLHDVVDLPGEGFFLVENFDKGERVFLLVFDPPQCFKEPFLQKILIVIDLVRDGQCFLFREVKVPDDWACWGVWVDKRLHQLGCLNCCYFLVLVFGEDERFRSLGEGLGSAQEALSRFGLLLYHAKGQGLIHRVGLLLLLQKGSETAVTLV